MDKVDIIIVGAGIIGAATAWKLSSALPGKRIRVVEKESDCAMHQTGRNSGVIHAGVYYQPGSLKAKYCKAGLQATLGFCREFSIPHLQCGKLIVATNGIEADRMESLYQRSLENGLDTRLIGTDELKRTEPNITGQGAILVNDTGIVDYPLMTRTMLEKFKANGGEVVFGRTITAIEEHDKGITVSSNGGQIQCQYLINCAGLMSDRLIDLQGLDKDFRIIPFRGEYFRLPEKYNNIVKHLIYPVPDPDMPFLGVHLTRMIDGSVTVGPNAVLATAREGYQKTDVNLKDMWDTFSFRGFWPLIGSHLKSGLREAKNSLFKRAYLQEVRKYCPQITVDDLLPYPSGVRAQAVTLDGKLMHDFRFVESEFSLHIGNAPSPAATSAIPIAETIVSKVCEKLQ